MKKHLIDIAAILRAIYTTSVNYILENRLATKTVSVFLIILLLMPLFFFGNWDRTSAQINPSSLPLNNSAPVSAPPLPYKFESSSNVLGSVMNSRLALVVSDSTSAIYTFVTPPKMPDGFELAQKPSPMNALILSSFASVGSFFDSVIDFISPWSSTSNSTTNTTTNMLTASSVEFDYDGDNKADLSVWQPSLGTWKIKKSSDGNFLTPTIGASNSLMAPGNFKGNAAGTIASDGTTDVAVFDSGTWTINPSNGSQYTVGFGSPGDKPVVGDYDGDGTSDIAVFRPSTNTWWILKSKWSNKIRLDYD